MTETGKDTRIVNRCESNNPKISDEQLRKVQLVFLKFKF